MAELREIDGLYLTVLRGGGPEFHAAVSRAGWASGPARDAEHDVEMGRALWLGPDEWLARIGRGPVAGRAGGGA